MTRAKRFRETEIPASTIIINDSEANELFLNTGDIPAPESVQYEWACGVCKNQIGHASECTPAQRDALADLVDQRRGEYRAAKMRRLGLSTAVGVASSSTAARGRPQARNSPSVPFTTSTASQPTTNSTSDIANLAARQFLSSIVGDNSSSPAINSSITTAQLPNASATSIPSTNTQQTGNPSDIMNNIRQPATRINTSNAVPQLGSSSSSPSTKSAEQSGISSTSAASEVTPKLSTPIKMNTVVSALLAPQFKIPRLTKSETKAKKAAVRMIVDNNEENERFLNTGQVKGTHTQYKWACGVCKSRNRHCAECTAEKREALEEQIKQRRTGYKAAYTARVEELRQVENAPAPKKKATPTSKTDASKGKSPHRDRKKASHRMIVDNAEENVRFLETGDVTGTHSQYSWACGVCRVSRRHTRDCNEEKREALANEVEARRDELAFPGRRRQEDGSISITQRAARYTLARNLAFQPYKSQFMDITPTTSAKNDARKVASTLSAVEVQRIARRVQRRLDGLPALTESEELELEKEAEEEDEEEEEEDDEEDDNFPAVWDRIHGIEASPAPGNGDGEGDEDGPSKPEHHTMRLGLALADKYCRDRCAQMPRMKGLQIKNRLLVTGPNCVQMRELFPDPVIMDKQEDEWFLLRGSAAVYWDPGMYFSHLFDMSTAKCVACGETSKQTCIHCPEGVDTCVCEEGVGVEGDKRAIARRGWTSGFQRGMRIDGGVDLIKTVSYKHRHCRAAQANGKRATHFTSMHPAFFKQLPMIVQRSLGFVVDPSSRTLASHNVARLATSLTQQHGLSWRACSRLLNQSSETLLKEKDDDQRVMSLTRRTKGSTTVVAAAPSPGPVASNTMPSPSKQDTPKSDVVPLSVTYERQMTSSLITQKRVARMVRQNLARLNQKEVISGSSAAAAAAAAARGHGVTRGNGVVVDADVANDDGDDIGGGTVV